MHWIAFNWLYSEYEGEYDSGKIRSFCRANYERLSNFDAFFTDAFQVFREQPVLDMARKKERMDLFRSIRQDAGSTRLGSLMLSIYQVRCNLFHGLKSINNDRDIALVKASSIILEGYLKVFFID